MIIHYDSISTLYVSMLFRYAARFQSDTFHERHLFTFALFDMTFALR